MHVNAVPPKIFVLLQEVLPDQSAAVVVVLLVALDEGPGWVITGVCVYACIYIYIYIYICMHTCVYVCMYVSMFVCGCACVCRLCISISAM